MNQKPKIAISLVNLDGIDYLVPAINSLLDSDLTDFEFKLFYWDNGSSDGAVDFIRNLKIPKSIFESRENQGIVQPRINLMNEIRNESIWDAVLEIHSDMLFPKVWFESLMSQFDDRTGILMPYIIQSKEYVSDLSLLERYVRENESEEILHNSIAVHPWVLNLNCIKDIGYYNPVYKLHRCEDDDLMFRVQFSKYDIKAYRKSIVFHKGEVIRKKLLKRNKNEKIFQKMHGISVASFSKLLLANGDSRIAVDN